ncbi:hypothetical protein [Terrisporobacter petrolearius]|uniref:hypothetical protein n=1 Tax=Terrisporobacter petrolearius TaxID=1460447 RepID=UPI0031CC9CDE
MVSKILYLINHKAKIACDNLYEYTNFVSDLEFVAEQNKDIFNSKALICKYHDLWFELEILNACALEECEEKRNFKDCSNIWNTKYKDDAINLVNSLLVFLETLDTR